MRAIGSRGRSFIQNLQQLLSEFRVVQRIRIDGMSFYRNCLAGVDVGDYGRVDLDFPRVAHLESSFRRASAWSQEISATSASVEVASMSPDNMPIIAIPAKSSRFDKPEASNEAVE